MTDKNGPFYPGKIVYGEKTEYKIDGYIGHGGNGCVYSVKPCQPDHLPDSENGYVIKVFAVGKTRDKEERAQRFEEEIRFLCTQGKGLEGIIPLYDAGTTKRHRWYLMPRAEKYDYANKTAEIIISDMLFVAETLSKIHESRNAHRDIKPENLMIYNGKLCLCDFGLVWVEGESHLTRADEWLGPVRIRPPELTRTRQDYMEYYKSDVYLFAKTLWIFLQKDNDGFAGPYERKTKEYLLNLSDTNVQTLEPVHCLLEEATRNRYDDRISITECINYLKRELYLLREASAEEVQAEIAIEETKKI